MRPSLRPACAALVVLAIVIALTQRRLSAAMPWRYPAVTSLAYNENYLTDLGCLMIGSRRLAADIAYIDFLQYYGVHEQHEEEPLTPEEEARLTPLEHAKREDISAGIYPFLKEKAERVLRIDPYFNGAVLEAAGALAFNQHRADESLALLKEGIERDPSYFRYHLYASAILYKQKGNDAGMIGLLMEAIKYPDCPPFFELILGNLLKKENRPLDAARVFLHTYLTAAKPNEKNDALRRLKMTMSEHPDVVRQIESEIPAE